MSEEEKKAIETLKGLTVYYDDYSLLDEEEIEENDNVNKSIQLIIDLIEKQQKELEKYKRLAEMNLKDAEEFQNNMCEHRCILYNEIEELKTELFEEKEKNKDLEEKLKIAVAMLTKGTYPEENEGDNDFNKKFIAVDKIKELLENEIIDISGFRCIAVEDIEELLEEK